MMARSCQRYGILPTEAFQFSPSHSVILLQNPRLDSVKLVRVSVLAKEAEDERAGLASGSMILFHELELRKNDESPEDLEGRDGSQKREELGRCFPAWWKGGHGRLPRRESRRKSRFDQSFEQLLAAQFYEAEVIRQKRCEVH